MKIEGALAAIALLAAVVPTLAFAWGPFGVQGNGQKVTQARQLQGFTHVELRGSLDADIKEGPFSVSVTADSNLQPLILTEVRGDTLVISQKQDLHPTKGARVEISLPDFRGVGLSGAGDVTVSGISRQNAVKLDVSGAGDVEYRGAAQALELDVSGAGDVKVALTSAVDKVSANVSGTGDIHLSGAGAQALELDISGTGNINARELPARATDVEISGTGNASTTVQSGGKLRAEVSGMGNLDWWGDVQEKSISKNGMGNVTHHG